MSGIYVIGGGAAGLAAAIAAAREGADVSVIERSEKPARKILATGGGRCNFTNMRMDRDSYYDCPSEYVSAFLGVFPPESALEFFFSMGLLPVIRDGYVYPRSEEAASVRGALLAECEKSRVRIHNNTTVTGIVRTGDGFDIQTEGYTYRADRVIIAAGGKASPVFGTDGSCYGIVRSLGHHVSSLSPGLSGIVCKSPITSASGSRVTASLGLYAGERLLRITRGEIQITDYGISGIPAMSLARIISRNKGSDLRICADFVPNLTEDEIRSVSGTRCGLSGLVPARLAAVLSQEADPAASAKNYNLIPEGTSGFDNAHVTSGGVELSETDPATFASRIVPGLFFAGEILDVDGLCGGYNLHFAWASGVMAGFSAATGRAFAGMEISDEHRAMFERCEIGSRRS